jgi:hypothetical protein
MKIVVDFDGTLKTLVNFPNGDKPILKVIKALQYFQKQGHEIIIVTARRHNSPTGYKNIIDLIERYNLNVKTIWIEGKQKAFLYIDDNSVNPENKDWLKKAKMLLNVKGKKLIKHYGYNRMNQDWKPGNMMKIYKRGKLWIYKKLGHV